ncbi:Reversal of tor2 lethality [Arachnomyces sp. PD_36]|nr:Reversal of tor2 lethality [Arachnomyces sp. PD_36]
MAVKNCLLGTLLLWCVLYISVGAARFDSELIGTWTTKSQKVLTGPGFYDYVRDEFKEPKVTGISYSFTSDGFYEEAYYRATSDSIHPECPGGIMQFQHGKYTRATNGTLYLTPFAEDGRELVSNRCNGKLSTYTMYNQTETFKRYQVGPDVINGLKRLDLFRFDGSPMPPMYLVYRPPLMVPTKELKPVPKRSIDTATEDHNTKWNRFFDFPNTPLASRGWRILAPFCLVVVGISMMVIGVSMLKHAFRRREVINEKR